MANPFSAFSELAPQFKSFAAFWWVWLPLLLTPLAINVWLMYVRERFKQGIKWMLLEIRIPRELKKTPKAMEQILAGIYGLRNAPGNFVEYWVQGEVTMWFSLEVTSFSGDIHFYIRTPAKHRNVIEALFYAHYPDIEITEAEDYMQTLPKNMTELHESGYELWGSELKLAREDAYPLRTYIDFSSPVEEEQLDPVSALMEVLGKMSRGEKLLLQVILAPADDGWRKKGDELLEDIKAKTNYLKKKKTVSTPEGGSKEIEERTMRAPGETKLLEAIDRNLSKPGFETIIRYLYVAPKTGFSENLPKRGIFTCFNQYGARDMNFFKHNAQARTQAWWVEPPYVFPKRRLAAKKRRILKNYRKREIPESTFSGNLFTSELYDWGSKSRVFVLNTEEVATVWHLPSNLVLTAPLIRRVESRKMGPPAGLPIFGGEDEERLPWLANTKK